MPKTPGVYWSNDNSQAGPVASEGLNLIVLGEASDGVSLNGDSKLIRIAGIADVEKLGSTLAGLATHDELRKHFQLGGQAFWFGRIVGATGAKAQTAVINDIQVSPVASIRLTWEGQGTDGNAYSLKVSRGLGSTTDTGATRLDSKLELLKNGVTIPGSAIDGVTMNAASPDYILSRWNGRGYGTLVDSTPADTYDNLDEPVVGTYPLTAGVNPAAATTTEIQAAITALDALGGYDLADVVCAGWTAADVNFLAGKALSHFWTIFAIQPKATNAAASAAYNATVTTNKDFVCILNGYGIASANGIKTISGLPVVTSRLQKFAGITGKQVNDIGMNQGTDGWNSFSEPNASEKQTFADSRTNPIYRIPITDRERGGQVVIGDCLSQAAGRYSQIGTRRTDNMVLTDVIATLNARVLGNTTNYPLGDKVLGVHPPENLNTFRKLGDLLQAIFSLYPPGLFIGGKGFGYDWAFDSIPGLDGPELQVKLGTKPSSTIRIAYVLLGEVAGRFTVVSGGA
jgi:hypothetical protein